MTDVDDTRRPASPTMTMHTKAATEEIYEMFNQPLQNDGSGSSTESNGKSDEEDDDDDDENDDDDDEEEDNSYYDERENTTEPIIGGISNLTSEVHESHINTESQTPAKPAGGRYAPNFPPMTPIAEATETIAQSAVKQANTNFSENYPTEPSSSHGILIPDLICDPTSFAQKEIIMNNSAISRNSNFHYNGNKSFGKKDMLRKTFTSSRRKSDMHNNRVLTIKFPGTSEMYSIRKLLGEGGFGCVYLAESEMGDIRAIKVENSPNSWECYILNLVYTKLTNAQHARELESIIQCSSMYLFRDESYLTLEYLDQGTVLNAVNISRQQTGNGLEECLVIYMTIQLLRVIEALHEAQIIHGDIKPDNVMLNFLPVKDSHWDRFFKRDGSDGWSTKAIKLIDFGRAIDVSAYHPDAQFMVDWKMDEQDCIEMRENRPWTYQADYHGIAGVIHCLLFGKFIHITELHGSSSRSNKSAAAAAAAAAGASGKGGPRREFGLSTTYKRYWQQHLWTELFYTLLNSQNVAESTGQSLPITSAIRDLRVKFERWLEENCETGSTSLKTAIKKIESALLENRKVHR